MTNKKDVRPSWDEYFLDLADAVSKRERKYQSGEESEKMFKKVGIKIEYKFIKSKNKKLELFTL